MKPPSLSKAQYLLTEVDPTQLPLSTAEVAFVGRSNSGKSSMINALCQQNKLARTSQTPGRTRTINIYAMAPLIWIVDLPGYGFASGPASSREGWQAMIEGYLTGRASLRCIYVIVDAKVGPTALDLQMAHWLTSLNLPFRVIANKVDQLKPSKRHVQELFIAKSLNRTVADIFWVSATEGIGIPALRQDVLKRLAEQTPNT